MGTSLPRTSGRLEDNRVGFGRRATDGPVNRVDRLADIPLEMAKAKLGAAMGQAIGDAPLKQFGDKGFLSKVCSGEKVPEYLARIYADHAARRRFARALLEGDDRVQVRTVVEWDEKVG